MGIVTVRASLCIIIESVMGFFQLVGNFTFGYLASRMEEKLGI